MAGAIALVGGEEFRRGCEDMDRGIMRASGKERARVLIIPTAAVTGPVKAANDGVTHFGNLGGDADRLMVLDRSQADDPGFIQAAEDADVIYFTGGNPDHLLESLRSSALLRTILAAVDRGAVLGGSSAGAMVMGSLMRRPGGGPWTEALGVVPRTTVLPHHERSDPEETIRTLRDNVPGDHTVLGVDARTGCLGGAGEWKVVGSGKVTLYQGGSWQIFESGEQLPSGVLG